MSLACYCYAMRVHAPNPLSKLVLLLFADGCCGSGELRPSEYVDFCYASEVEVQRAVFDLVQSGILTQNGPHWFTINGYVPPDYGGEKPVYIKRTLSKRTKKQVLERDGGCCQTCGRQDDLCVDHKHPERHGGTDELDNLQTLCRSCNSRKKDRLP